MCGPDHDVEKMAVLADVPEKLTQALQDGMKPIGVDCIKQNAEFVFRFYETICVDHVLDLQMQNSLVRQLTQRNPNAATSTESALVPAGRMARSSLIGRDICGDTARPEPEGSDGETDTAAAAVDAEEQSEQSKKKTEKKKKYSGLQILQIEVQDKTYLYLTVHVFRLVEPFFRDLLKNRENEYKANKDGILTKSPRSRMSWSEYKNIVLDRLQKGHGWHFMCQLVVNLHRQNGEQCRSWLQRVGVGKD